MITEKELVDKIIEAQCQAEKFDQDEPVIARPGPPVSPEELQRLESSLDSIGMTCPPSFRRLLQAYNGVENFLDCYNLSLRSAKTIIERRKEDEYEWDEFHPEPSKFGGITMSSPSSVQCFTRDVALIRRSYIQNCLPARIKTGGINPLRQTKLNSLYGIAIRRVSQAVNSKDFL